MTHKRHTVAEKIAAQWRTLNPAEMDLRTVDRNGQLFMTFFITCRLIAQNNKGNNFNQLQPQEMRVLERYREVSRIRAKTPDNRDIASYFGVKQICWIIRNKNNILEAQ